MASRTSDFPFTIMDVVELLRLHIRRRSSATSMIAKGNPDAWNVIAINSF